MVRSKDDDKQPRDQTISELAGELDLTPRTIRFYEEKGLINPRRTSGNHRLYSRRDRARLKLIMRGRRFGYSLDEIAEMIGPADQPLDEVGQIKRSLAYGDRTLKEIDRRQAELEEMKSDLTRVKRKLKTRLKQIERENES